MGSLCRSSPLIASIEASGIYHAAARWRNRLIIGFGQNQVQIWQTRKPGDQERGLNQLGKIDILRFWQLRRTRRTIIICPARSARVSPGCCLSETLPRASRMMNLIHDFGRYSAIAVKLAPAAVATAVSILAAPIIFMFQGDPNS